MAGEIQLGIVPIRDDNCVKFGGIDIDDYKLDHKKLASELSVRKLPLVLIRSKSGGGHVSAFFKNASDAAKVRELLAGWAALLGHAEVEIFPKQSKLASPQDTGNWINMPYSGGNKSDRYALDDKGGRLSLEEFLDRAERMTIGSTMLESADEFPELLEGAPPCLVTLASRGFPDGTRNNGLFNLGIYAIKRWPDEWEERLVEMNERFIHPALESGEVQQIIKHLSTKSYFYRCKEPPIKSVCQKSICVRRKFGITQDGLTENFDFQIDNVICVKTNPPIYYGDYCGFRISFTADQICSQKEFQKRLINQSGLLLSMRPVKVWEGVMHKVLASATNIDAPQDIAPEHDILEVLEDYCVDKIPAMSWEDLRDGGAFEHDGRMYFRVNRFLQNVSREYRQKWSRSEVWQAIRPLGARDELKVIGGKGMRLWSVPAFVKPVKRELM